MLSRSRLTVVCVRRRFLSTAAPLEPPSREKAPAAVLKAKEAREGEPPHQGWVRLHDLPWTISPADVSRHVHSLIARDPEFVHLDYRNFMPSGRAWLRFPDAGIADEALRVLRESVIAGHKIRAQKVDEHNVIAAGAPARYRGPRGRSEALQRDLIDGHGPDAKLKERGMNVYLWGLPGTMMAPELVKLLDSYGLRVTAEETNPIQKIERKSPTARFLVRLSSVSGAQRLVRDFHMTEKFEEGYLVHAQVVY